MDGEGLDEGNLLARRYDVVDLDIEDGTTEGGLVLDSDLVIAGTGGGAIDVGVIDGSNLQIEVVVDDDAAGSELTRRDGAAGLDGERVDGGFAGQEPEGAGFSEPPTNSTPWSFREQLCLSSFCWILRGLLWPWWPWPFMPPWRTPKRWPRKRS